MVLVPDLGITHAQRSPATSAFNPTLTTPTLILQASVGAMSELSVKSSYQESADAAKGDVAKLADKIMLSNSPAKPTEGLSKVREVAPKLGNLPPLPPPSPPPPRVTDSHAYALRGRAHMFNSGSRPFRIQVRKRDAHHRRRNHHHHHHQHHHCPPLPQTPKANATAERQFDIGRVHFL